MLLLLLQAAPTLARKDVVARVVLGKRQGNLYRCKRLYRQGCSVFGGQDPTGFAEEVRALANAHKEELEQAMTEEGPALGSTLTADSATAVPGGAGLAGAAEKKAGGGPGVGLEFWSRQSDLWSGGFAEQQTGLLQMVRAQEAELRQGKRRISSLEKELSALSDKRAKMAATAEAKGREDRGRALGEEEVDEWRQRLERMRACLLYTSPSPRDLSTSRMPSSA